MCCRGITPDKAPSCPYTLLLPSQPVVPAETLAGYVCSAWQCCHEDEYNRRAATQPSLTTTHRKHCPPHHAAPRSASSCNPQTKTPPTQVNVSNCVLRRVPEKKATLQHDGRSGPRPAGGTRRRDLAAAVPEQHCRRLSVSGWDVRRGFVGGGAD